MSPSAIGGPHTRASSINGGPVSTKHDNGEIGMNGLKGVNRVFPHFDDLVAVRPENHASIRKLLEAGEKSAKQADTFLDFKRPDVALQEYIKACTIAVELIPRHQEYPTLQADGGELSRLYIALNKRLFARHGKFEDVKKLVKENNAQSGVKSFSLQVGVDPVYAQDGLSNRQMLLGTGSDVDNRKSSGINNLKHIDEIASNAPTHVHGNPEGRSKPPIQPKPQSLHGNIIHTTNGISTSSGSSNDLAARFARLRSLESALPTQDPRIRTRPISFPDPAPATQISTTVEAHPKQSSSIARPLGPREMPSVSLAPPKPGKPVLGMDIPTMPRPPDAIYSPARSADLISSSNHPPLISRGSSYLGNVGRRGSTASLSKNSRTPVLIDNRRDYFSPPSVSNYTLDGSLTSETDSKSDRPDIPDSTTISAEDLMAYLRMGTKALRVLLVDLRNREQFDNGHIMSQSIICIEPISLRYDMSAEDLGERIVLSPESEQRLYSQWHDFDLVVYYDQSSESTRSNTSAGLESANYLQIFTKVIFDHAYDRPLMRRPMLLVGGLDAWVDLVGQGALQISKLGERSVTKSSKPAKPLSRVPMARGFHHDMITMRKPYAPTNLSKTEEVKWDETLRGDAIDEHSQSGDYASDELFYARTTEEFFRKYPELPSTQESMVTLSSIPRSMAQYDDHEMPLAPTCPAPALPRQRSSGVSEKGPFTVYAMTAPPANPDKLGLCGLQNYTGATCYMNATMQALSGTPEFRRHLINFKYPPKQGEEIQKIFDDEGAQGHCPQLMVRNVSALLRHMWCGKYDYLVPKNFTLYVKAAHASKLFSGGTSTHDIFGTSTQQDASEFLIWLLETLHDETNKHRNAPKLDQSKDEFIATARRSFIDYVRRYRRAQSDVSDSMITKYFGLQISSLTRCKTCNQIRHVSTQPSTVILTTVPSETHATASLAELFNNALGEGVGHDIVEFACSQCQALQQTNVGRNTNWITTLPKYLIIYVTRFDNEQAKTMTRDTYLNFPQVLDMTPWVYREVVADPNPPPDQKCREYDCYAVIQHRGSLASGHYWALVRQTTAQNILKPVWKKFNDNIISDAKWSGTQGTTASILFYVKREKSV